ncbi:MAG TPA: Holliday junction resolvase RuvX [Tepidisphaeraceae bacterium]|nr:Holliday junction resolvase RuvX [Tepidisphaeraceae bacterium]
MRTLAIDLGTRRVGLALSDEGGRLATPYEVVQVTSTEVAAIKVLEVIAREGVQRIVLGLPLNMDDSFGPAARQTVAWGKEIARSAHKPIVYVDERLSSFAAEQDLNERKRGGEKLTRKRRKEQLDALAAAGFLQAFLDGKLQSLDVSRA